MEKAQVSEDFETNGISHCFPVPSIAFERAAAPLTLVLHTVNLKDLGVALEF